MWLKMEEPRWPAVSYPPIDYQDAYYYAAPTQKAAPKSLEEVDPELLRTYEKLGIPLKEQAWLAGVRPDGELEERDRLPVAVDAVFDSVSVATTFKEPLANERILLCPMSEAVHNRPQLVRECLGSVVAQRDNFFAALDGAGFTDGSFVCIP